jgi:hypothetical protein
MFVAPQTAWYSFSVTALARCSLSIGISDDFSAGMRSAYGPSWDPYFDYVQYDYRRDTLTSDQTTEKVCSPVALFFGGLVLVLFPFFFTLLFTTSQSTPFSRRFAWT